MQMTSRRRPLCRRTRPPTPRTRMRTPPGLRSGVRAGVIALMKGGPMP